VRREPAESSPQEGASVWTELRWQFEPAHVNPKRRFGHSGSSRGGLERARGLAGERARAALSHALQTSNWHTARRLPEAERKVGHSSLARPQHRHGRAVAAKGSPNTAAAQGRERGRKHALEQLEEAVLAFTAEGLVIPSAIHVLSPEPTTSRRRSGP
jgi:hypothetical protein